MKKIILSLFAVSAVLVSCDKNEIQNPSHNSEGITISASIDDDATKSTYENKQILWASGDRISLLNSANTFDVFTLSSGEGSKKGSFTGNLTEGTTPAAHAVYPAGAHSYDGTAFTVNLPTSYGDASAEYVPNTNALMLGTSSGAAYSFKHLGGIICATVGAPVGTSKISLTAAGIAGDFAVTEVSGNKVIAKAGDAADATVSYVFKALAESKDMVFYFPVPTGEYKSLKFELKDASDAVLLTKTLYPYRTIERAHIAKLPKLTIETGFDFEADYDRFGCWGGNSPTKSLSKAEAKSGVQSLLLANPVASNMWDAQLGYEFAYKLDMNKTYKVSFFVKSDVAGQIQFQYQSKDYANQGGYKDFDTTSEWQYFETKFTPSHDNIQRLIINFGKIAANYYIDDFYFGEVVPAANLITNGDFESGTDGWTGFWGKYTYVVDPAGHEGQCLTFTLTAECANQWDAQLFWPIELTSGKTYSYSFWAKSDTSLQVQFIGQNDAYDGIYADNNWAVTSEWKKYSGSLVYKASDKPGMCRVGLQFGKADSAGKKVWLDDIMFSEE